MFQGIVCSTNAPQARRWCSSRLRPGTCRAAPQRPARFPRHRPPKSRYERNGPAGGVSPPDPRNWGGAGTARGGGGRGDGRRLEERGASRRGPRRPTIQQHHCAPNRVLAHTHRLAPYRARGAAPTSPASVNWPFPPRAERGSSAVPIQQRAGHQAVDYSRGASRRRSLKLPRRPRQPATRRQGARRGAHRRPPHTNPTTTDFQPSPLGGPTHPARIFFTHIPCG